MTDPRDDHNEGHLAPWAGREMAAGRFIHSIVIAQLPNPTDLWKWKRQLGIEELPNLAAAVLIGGHAQSMRLQSDRQKLTYREALTNSLKSVWPSMLADWHEDLEYIILLAADTLLDGAEASSETQILRIVEEQLASIKLPFGATLHAGLSHVVDSAAYLPAAVRAARDAAKHAKRAQKLLCVESDIDLLGAYDEYEEYEMSRAESPEPSSELSPLSLGAKPQMIQDAISFIKGHLNEDLELEKIAAHCMVSHYYLSHLFRKETGFTVTAFIKKSRIDKAKELLKRPEYSVADVAYSVGFQDPNYFSKSFRSHVGLTPTEFRGKIL